MRARRGGTAATWMVAILAAVLAMIASTAPFAAAQGFETEEAPREVFDVPSQDDLRSSPEVPRIINGANLADGDLPFLTAIFMDGNQVCGGTLIAASVVMTAAHCVTDPQFQPASASRFSVGLGSSDIRNVQIRPVARILVHPDFGAAPPTPPNPSWTLTHDIALIYLSTPASFTSEVGVVPAIEIDPAFPVVGSGALVAGWGNTDRTAFSPSRIAKVVFVDVTKCSLKFRQVGQICVNGPGTNASCRGDSGGPVLQQLPNGNLIVIGLVSQGSEAACGGSEAGYERTAQHAAWILQNSPRPQIGNGFVPLPPRRILDSRPGQSGEGLLNNSYSTPWGPGSIREMQLLGVGGVPPRGVRSVLAHVTSVGPTADSYIVAWAGGMPGGDYPSTAAKNFGTTPSGPYSHAGLTNDLVVLPVGPDGATLVRNAFGSVDFVVDVVGYFDVYGSGDPFSSVTPSRILDSRPGQPGQGANNVSTPWGAGTTRTVQVAGVGGVPSSGVTAVAAHVTSVQPTANSWLTAWASGARPTTAVKNFGPVAGGRWGHTAVANDLLILPVSPGGTVRLYNQAGSVHFAIDVVGWFGPGADSLITMVPSTRVLDSRPSQPGMGFNDSYNSPWGTGTTRQVQLSGVRELPASGVSAVFAHVTSVSPSRNSWLTVWGGGNRPVAAAKNFGPSAGGPGGHTAITNDLVIIPTSGSPARGWFYNQAGSTHFVVDVVGYAD